MAPPAGNGEGGREGAGREGPGREGRAEPWGKDRPLISFRNVYKSFGPKHVYTGLDLDVYEGEALVILGGSGVGKSVMLKILIGLLLPDRGSVKFRGEEVVGMSEDRLAEVRQRIAFLFQSAALFDSLSVYDNVAYALNEHHFRTMSKADIGRRVSWALELVGLPGTENMRPADLSGGMRKRAGLARAIALQPEVLLYDEPTTGLDPINTTRINRLITGLQKALNITSIVVTHDMRSAFEIADRLAMVHRGRIILQDENEAFKKANDPRVRDFIDGRAPEAESVESLLGDLE
jgi:phospholipid/cholesterol/gamma-HCH transport system ATP-binding protein